MKPFGLTAQQCSSLEHLRRFSRDARVVRRAQALLWRAQGYSVAQVAGLSGVSSQTVYNWVARFQQGDSTLADQPRSGRPPLLGRHVAWLEQRLHQDPQTLGYQQSTWTIPLLRHDLLVHLGINVSPRTLRRSLHRLGYRWKRPRYALARRDPLRQEKRGPSASSPGAPQWERSCSSRMRPS